MADTIYEEPYLPGDPRLVDKIVRELKSQGIFDQFRKECIADVDTKPAYQNLRQRVEGSVGSFLSRQRWKPTLNKNQLREKLRKHIHDSNFLDQGVERIVDQVVNPKVGSVFIPKVEDVVYQYLGFDTTEAVNTNRATAPYSSEPNSLVPTGLLPTDLEAVSPDSVKSQEMKDDIFVDKNQSFMDTDFHLNERMDIKNEKFRKSEIIYEVKKSLDDSNEDLESPPFEPLESAIHEEHSQESQLSGISDLTSHDSMESKPSTSKPEPLSWGTQGDLDISGKKIVSDKEMFDSQSHDDDTSSDSILRREMSPLTPVHNFDENSGDAQPPFTDSSNDIKKELDTLADAEINFKTVQLTNPPRLSIESKSSPDVKKYSHIPDVMSDDSKTSVFAPIQPEVVPLEDRFNTQIDLNDYGPSDNESSNSNHLHIVYDSPKSEQNEYLKMKEDMSSIPLPMDLDIPMPDDEYMVKKTSEIASQGEVKKSSSHHKSSRDSHQHSSKHSSSSRHKHSSSSRDRKDSHKSDKKSDSHHESHRSRSHHKDLHTEKTKDKSDSLKSSSKSKEKSSETLPKSSSTHRESSSKSSSHKSRHSSSSRHRNTSSSSHKHGDKTNNDTAERHKSSNSDSKVKSKSISKDREKKDDKTSLSKDRHKSSSSHHSEKDRKHSDSKNSSSNKDKYDEKKSDKKDKVKSSDDHYSSSGRAGRTRRSTDRDSNDGNNSSSKTNAPSTSKTSSSEHRRHHTNPKTDSTSVSNDSSTQSDCVESKFKLKTIVGDDNYDENSKKILMKPVMRIDNQLNTPLGDPPKLPDTGDLPKLKKPRIASNIHEARELMKIRKQMDIDEVKRQQEVALEFEIRENVARNSSRVFSGISGPELEFTCSDRLGLIDLVPNDDIYSDDDRDTSDDDFEYEDDVQEDLNYFGQGEIDQAFVQSEQQIKFYNKYSEYVSDTKKKVHFLYCDKECEDVFTNTLNNAETVVNLNKNSNTLTEEESLNKMQFNLTVDLERESIMSDLEEGTIYKISEIQNKNIVKKINIETDMMIEINTVKKKVTETNLRTRNEFDEQIEADLNNSSLDSSLDSVNSDYYNRIDDIMNNTSKQQIMEVIFGGGSDLTSSPTKFAYNYDSSYFNSPKESPRKTVKRKASTEVFETLDGRESVERSENNNRKVLTINKVRKVSSTEHISSTTEGETTTTVAVTARSSKFTGKARRVGLSRPKNSLKTAPKSPSSDRSVENYNQNCLDETQSWIKNSPDKNQLQPRPKPKRRPKQEMQRYDPSDLYKPRPSFLLSRRSNIN